MNNRWSDAARAASLAVRQVRLMAARPTGPGRGSPVPARGRTAPKPIYKPEAGAGKPGIPQPNIFYSSAYPFGPGQEGSVRGILRFDPWNPVDAEELGYNMGPWKGKFKKSIPPVSERYKDDWMTIPRRKAKEAEEARKRYPQPSSTGSRTVIGGKIYLRIGRKMVPYRDSAGGGLRKVYYQK